MLLEALAVCAGVTLRSVATSLGVEVRGGSVTAEGELDFRGTLAIEKRCAGGIQGDPRPTSTSTPTPPKETSPRCCV
jgi:hypothetical protein